MSWWSPLLIILPFRCINNGLSLLAKLSKYSSIDVPLAHKCAVSITVLQDVSL